MRLSCLLCLIVLSAKVLWIAWWCVNTRDTVYCISTASAPGGIETCTYGHFNDERRMSGAEDQWGFLDVP